MKKKLLFTLLFIVFCYVFVSLTFFIRYYSIDPEGALLQALKSHKAVMLGDFCHGAALPHKTVILLLLRWLDDLKNGNKELRHLTLVLECDSSETLQIKEFIKDGNLPGAAFMAINHLEKLEFFADLGQVAAEVDKLNSHEPVNDKISFDIFGAEPPADLGGVYTRMDLNKSLEFFALDRDVLISRKILAYAKANPEQKFLIFYGSAHMLRGRRNKDLWGFLPGKDMRGHFLIHYLEEAFGRKEVFSANQGVFTTGRQLDSRVCEFITGKDSDASMIFFSNPVEMWLTDLFSGKRPSDAIIVRRTRLIQPTFLSATPLAENVRRCLARLEQLKDATGFLAKRDVGELKKLLHYSTGKKAESTMEWQTMLDDGSFISWIEAEKMPERANKLYDSESKAFTHLFGKLLTSFRTTKNDQKTASESWLIRSLFCVDTMWAGNQQEKAFAKEALLKESGIDSNRPGDYLAWIRKKCFLVNY